MILAAFSLTAKMGTVWVKLKDNLLRKEPDIEGVMSYNFIYKKCSKSYKESLERKDEKLMKVRS